MKTKNKGFTLIEILIVILIIGILASVAITQYRYSVAKAKFTQLLTMSKAIMDAQKRYKTANGERSLDLSALDVRIEGCSFVPGPYSSSGMKDALSCPWGSCTITYNSARDSLSCSLSKPAITYFVPLLGIGNRYCCAYQQSANVSKKLCQSLFPKSTGVPSGSYCGSTATLYQGQPELN